MYNIYYNRPCYFGLRTGHCRLRSHMKKIGIKKSALCPCGLEAQTRVMPSPQKRKRKHLVNRKFPRKQTPWNSHRPTPDDAVHRPDGTTNNNKSTSNAEEEEL